LVCREHDLISFFAELTAASLARDAMEQLVLKPRISAHFVRHEFNPGRREYAPNPA
jgi:hypothetical protein